MSEEEKEKKEKELSVNVLVDELMKVYTNVRRGDIYEAAMCISDEKYLTNTLIRLEKDATYVPPAGGVGEIFSKTNPRELDGIIDMGEKLSLSKPSTILLAGIIGLGRVVYTSLTDEELLKRLDGLELKHNENMLKKAAAILDNNSNNSNTDASKKNNNKGK